MNSGKILLCDLSKGKIGEDVSFLMGSLITAKLQLAALKRITTPEAKRRDFFLYIDEFQNFATPSFAEMMSEARKYRLNAILAHQTTAQIADRDFTRVILANTGTIICFRNANPSEEEFILPSFLPSVVKGDISNLPAYSFYIKINALKPQDSFSGETIYTPTKKHTKIYETIKQHSRTTYGRPVELIEKDIMTILERVKPKKTAQDYAKEIAEETST